MTAATRLILTAAALVASVAIASAQTAQDHQAHHPADQTAAQVQPPATPPGQRQMGRGPAKPGGMGMGMGAQGGQDMMGGAMAQTQMAAMMQMMRDGMMPMGMGPAGMQPLRHIEGQIAFYKAELKITDAQAPQWNAFADALRSTATRMQQAMTPGTGTQGRVAAPEQIERRVAMLTAQLDAMQAVLATAKPLYIALTDDQKKIADELMAEHMMAMRARGL